MNAIHVKNLYLILRKMGTGIFLGVLVLLVGCRPHRAVTIYHYDDLRSGWNSQENQLNYTNVSGSSLSPLVMKIDYQVDTQPLIVPNLQIARGKHGVVYVTTEANNIYAFNANTGMRLKMVNLGPSVPMPQGCNTNGPTTGIEGTPVIDLLSSTIYVITYNLENSKPVYFIPAVDLATLNEKVPRQPITAKQTLTDGNSFSFDPSWQRQRFEMLLANGNVYAWFGGLCDCGGPQGRGWVLSWQTPLTVLPVAVLHDRQPSQANREVLVSNGGSTLGLWNLQTSPKPELMQTGSANLLATIQDPGFFATVSSNGQSNAIKWAISRPQTNNPPSIWLYAFKATPSGNTLALLFQSVAGSWPYPRGNGNLIPVVANGRVHVVSDKGVNIFGLGFRGAQGAQKVKARTEMLARAPGPQLVQGPEEHQLSGIVRKIDGNHLTIETRNSKMVELDVTEAKGLSRHSAAISVWSNVAAAGLYDSNGVMKTASVWRAKPSPAAWPSDR